MDRVYKSDIPAIVKALDDLMEKFSGLDSKTNWVRLRIQPLHEHALRLERLLRSPKFARETSRLTKGVSMFHSDLVYFRENLKTLQLILKSGRKPAPIRSGASKGTKKTTATRREA